MQVNSTPGVTSSPISSVANRAASQSDFQAAFAAAKQNLVGSNAAGTALKSSESKVANVSATHKTAGEELAEYQSKSVAQHLRDAILKEMGLTEEELDAMPPEQRAAIEETIAEKIKERLLAQGDGTQSAAHPAASLLSLLTQGQGVIEQLSQSATSAVATGLIL